jgi:hypothetical protein
MHGQGGLVSEKTLCTFAKSPNLAATPGSSFS